MKVKLLKIANGMNSLKFLSEQVLPAKTSLRVAKILNIVSGEMELVEQTRRKLIVQYNLEKEETQNADNIKGFQKDMASVLEEEIEIPFEPIPINELGSIHLSVAHLMNLDFMFKD